MPTPVQIAAQKELEETRRHISNIKTVINIEGAVANIALPGASVISIIYGHLCEWSYREHISELEKAARGERDTLPEMPKDESGDAFLGAC